MGRRLPSGKPHFPDFQTQTRQGCSAGQMGRAAEATLGSEHSPAGCNVLIKLLPPSSVPHFSTLLFDDKSLKIRFPLPAVSLLESTSKSARRKLGGWWRQKGPACLLFLSASLWQTPSSFPHTPPTFQPPNPQKSRLCLTEVAAQPGSSLASRSLF